MLTEEALILLATLGATGILILGVVELVWPSRPTPTRTRRARVAPTSDVDSETKAAIQRLAQTASAPREAETAEPSAGASAALLDLVGLSKQELGDRDGARMAFRAAIRRAAPHVRATYVRHLLAVVRRVADLDLTSEDSDATRLRELRGCMAALDDALSMVPGDEGVRATQAMVRDALSPACERLVARVVSGDEDQEARELVLETLTDHAMPTAWREGLREQLTSVSSAEIGQLTAQAMRSVQDGNDAHALEALERA